MPLAVGLSGSGFLIVFLLGALVGLEEGGAIKRLGVPSSELATFAGSSGGAILAVASGLGLPYDVVYRETSRLADYCAAHNDCALSLDAEVRRTLQAALHGAPDQVALAEAVARCRGRVFVNLSVFSPFKTTSSDTNDDEDDGDDGDNPFNAMRGRRFKSGGRSRNTTDPLRRSNANALSEIGLGLRPGALLCDAAASKPGARVALLAATQRALPPGLGLHPRPWLVSDWIDPMDIVDAVAASAFNSLLSGLAPTTSFRGSLPLIADGIYTTPLPVPPEAKNATVVRISAVPEGFALAPGSAAIRHADIAPGKRTGPGLLAGLTVEEWLCHSVVVADPATRRAMYELGRREAELYLLEGRERGGGRAVTDGGQ